MAQKKKTKSAKSKPAKKATASKASKAKDIKYVYDFGKKTDGDAKQRELLGGKGANLAEMARIGLPVPPGFTITTEVCTHYYANGKTYPAELQAQVDQALARVEQATGRTFGDP